MSGLVGYLNNPVTIVAGADDSNSKEWIFDSQGNITLPIGGDIIDSTGVSLLGTDSGIRKSTAFVAFDAPTVIWTGIDPTVSSAKLFIQAQCEVTGDASGPHTQSCEIIIASRSSLFTPVISVYGIVYTSVSQLITFTTQRNLSSNCIEIVATASGAVSADPLLRIYSIEQLSRI
jgi:hypothetical protein